MTPTIPDAAHVDEAQLGKEFADWLNRVAASGQPVIVQRGGSSVAALVSVEHLDLLREMLARQEAQELAGRLDWKKLATTSSPPQDWFAGEEPKPF